MPKANRSALVALPTALLGVIGVGCLPAPRWETETPLFTGIVVRGDKPVAGATVLLNTEFHDSGCANPLERATTDDVGRFELPAVTRFRAVGWLIGDPLFDWSICIAADGAQFPGHFGGDMGNLRSRVPLRCDLENQRREPTGICVESE
jgi:hypothetical protein